jgi:glycosyltransferase involved in cell wall biosynthesis
MTDHRLSKLWSPLRPVFDRLRRDEKREASSLHLAVLAGPLLRYSAAQAIGIKQAGARATLLYVDNLQQFDGNEGDRDRFLADVEAHGVEVVRLEPRRLVRTAKQTRALLRELRARDVTGLIAQQHFEPRYSLVGLWFPTLLVLHDPRPHSGDMTAPRWPAPLVARLSEGTASCLMLHSERLVPQLRPALRKVPRIIVPHGATIAPAAIARPDSPMVLLAGRLLAYKGVDAALDAFPLVRSAVPDATLLVAGRGPMAAEARNRGLEGVRVQEGYVPESRLEELLEEASVVLLPYRDATQSGVGLLAAGRGIPCVVSSQGGLPDILGSLGSDLVWTTDDPVDLASAIVAALGKDDDYRTAVHRRAAELFAWDVLGARLISHLARLGFGLAVART